MGAYARCNMVKPVQFSLVLNLQAEGFELLLEVAERHELSGVVGCKGRPLEFLSKNLIAGTDALRVECGREEPASSLDKSALHAHKLMPVRIPSSDPAAAHEGPTSCRYIEWTFGYECNFGSSRCLTSSASWCSFLYRQSGWSNMWVSTKSPASGPVCRCYD